MIDHRPDARGALIFGARNLGKAIIHTLVEEGWAVAGVARSQSTLDGIREAGALALRADVTDRSSVRGALREVKEAHGQVDLLVNAASAYGGTRSGPFGGGPIADSDIDGFDSWAVAPARSAFSFLSAAGEFCLEQKRPATIIQVTGGSSRRAMAGRGLWAAGAFSVRAITQATALELREHGIHVALLIIDAGIQPPHTRSGGPEGESEALADPRQISDAVLFLAEQGARAATHELQVTPLAETWLP
ncbi:MAG: SDR family oxidoreductase [Solirubrobacteraceae bacterium]